MHKIFIGILMRIFFFMFPLIAFFVISVEVKALDSWNNKVLLVTYPRSGNHWMRYLIEEATGIATSSVYQDQVPMHENKIFPWGGYCPFQGYEGCRRYPLEGEIIVIKTHFPFAISPYDKKPWIKALRIIRHPIDSFYSHYVYGKIPEQFIPQERLKREIKEWRIFQKYWDSIANVFTIRYEDLYNNPWFYLREALEYIGYNVSQQDIDRAIAKYPPIGGPLKHIHHFTARDLAFIKKELGDLLEQYGYGTDF